MPETQSPGSAESKDTVPRGSRRLLSRGLATVLVATGGLFLASELFAPTSLYKGTLETMLP